MIEYVGIVKAHVFLIQCNAQSLFWLGIAPQNIKLNPQRFYQQHVDWFKKKTSWSITFLFSRWWLKFELSVPSNDLVKKLILQWNGCKLLDLSPLCCVTFKLLPFVMILLIRLDSNTLQYVFMRLIKGRTIFDKIWGKNLRSWVIRLRFDPRFWYRKELFRL